MLDIFSTATNALLMQIPLDRSPRGLVFSPDGAVAYVLTQDNTFFVRITTIDIAALAPVAQFWFSTTGFNYFFRISPDGTYFYGGGNANPGGNPDGTAWSAKLSGTPVAIPSAQGVLDIGVRRPPPLSARRRGQVTGQ